MNIHEDRQEEETEERKNRRETGGESEGRKSTRERRNGRPNRLVKDLDRKRATSRRDNRANSTREPDDVGQPNAASSIGKLRYTRRPSTLLPLFGHVLHGCDRHVMVKFRPNS